MKMKILLTVLQVVLFVLPIRASESLKEGKEASVRGVDLLTGHLVTVSVKESVKESVNESFKEKVKTSAAKEEKNFCDKQKGGACVEEKKGLVVTFLSAKCPCSNSHIAELKDLAASYPEFAFVAVHSNADEPVDLSKRYFSKAGLPFPIIEDKNFELADKFHALKTPHTFVLNSDSKILYQGGVSNSKDCAASDRKYLREALNDLQHDQAVKTPEGRTLGCAITRI